MKVLEKPYTDKEIKENQDADGYVTGSVAVSVDEIIEAGYISGFDEFNALLSRRLTGNDSLKDISSVVTGIINVGTDNTEIIIKVTGRIAWPLKAYKVSWHVSGYTGTFHYRVVAENLENAKKMWDEFVKTEKGKKVAYSWEKASKGVENHHGGYIIWESEGETNKENGCYELPYEEWSKGTDHRWD